MVPSDRHLSSSTSDSSRTDGNETHVAPRVCHAGLESADAISPRHVSTADTAAFEHVSQGQMHTSSKAYQNNSSCSGLSQSLSRLRLAIRERATTGFFSLAPEIRNKIYILALEDYVATFKTPDDFWLHDPIPRPPIALINCHARSECLPIFFELVRPKGLFWIALKETSAGTSVVHPDNMHWLRKAAGNYEMDQVSIAISMLAPNEKDTNLVQKVVQFIASVNGGDVGCSLVCPHLERCCRRRRKDPCWKAGHSMAYKIEGILEGAMRSRCPVDDPGFTGITLADLEQVRLFCESREDVFDVPARL